METTHPSLLIRVRNRSDQAAWFEFDAIYRPMLIRFGRVRGLSEVDADEIAQQSMAAVHDYIGRFDYDPRRGRFKAWLRTMVNNRIKNRYRDRRDVQAQTADFKDLRDDEAPDELFDRVWRHEHLKHCLIRIRTEVEETTFNIFVAHVMEEKPIEEVCKDFDTNPNRVHAIKSRMVKRIRSRMIELLGTEA